MNGGWETLLHGSLAIASSTPLNKCMLLTYKSRQRVHRGAGGAPGPLVLSHGALYLFGSSRMKSITVSERLD